MSTAPYNELTDDYLSVSDRNGVAGEWRGNILYPHQMGAGQIRLLILKNNSMLPLLVQDQKRAIPQIDQIIAKLTAPVGIYFQGQCGFVVLHEVDPRSVAPHRTVSRMGLWVDRQSMILVHDCLAESPATLLDDLSQSHKPGLGIKTTGELLVRLIELVQSRGDQTLAGIDEDNDVAELSMLRLPAGNALLHSLFVGKKGLGRAIRHTLTIGRALIVIRLRMSGLQKHFISMDILINQLLRRPPPFLKTSELLFLQEKHDFLQHSLGRMGRSQKRLSRLFKENIRAFFEQL